MEKIKFNGQDKQQFSDFGYCNADIEQIEDLRYTVTDYSKNISFDEACNLLGRKYVLSAIGRAAFHWSGNINRTKWSVKSSLF
jgi:hypothetical protein